MAYSDLLQRKGGCGGKEWKYLRKNKIFGLSGLVFVSYIIDKYKIKADQYNKFLIFFLLQFTKISADHYHH